MPDYLHETISGIIADMSGIQDGYTLVFDQESGKFKVARGGTGSGGATDKWPSKVIRDNYSIISKEFGYTYIITGCDNTNGEVILALPPVTQSDLGAWFRIVKSDPNTKVTILCNTNETIMDSSAGGKLFNSTSEIGSNVEIQLISLTNWSIVSGLGNWTTE